MAFAFLSEANFEDGTLGHFESETDTETRLDFPHYATLAAAKVEMPWNGAYCMRVNLKNDGSPADAHLTETGSWDMTAGTGEIYGRFMLYVSDDIVMANTNEFAILLFDSSGPVIECGIYINYTTANGLRLGIGKDTSAASSFADLSTGVWHTVEFFFDPAGSSASTFDCWLDGTALTQLTGFTSADITQGRFGVVGQDAGTTHGTLLFDSIITDDARVFAPIERRPKAVLLTKSGHLFVGEGCIEELSLLAGAGTDCVLTLYDTDNAYTSDATNVVVELKNTSNNQAVPELPVRVRRGAYVTLSGTTPRALAQIGRAPTYYSLDLQAHWGRKRSGSTSAG